MKENTSLISSRLDKSKSEYNKTLLDFKSGTVPSLEVDVKLLNFLKIENSLNGLVEELNLLEKKSSMTTLYLLMLYLKLQRMILYHVKNWISGVNRQK